MQHPLPILLYDANCILCSMLKDAVASSGWRDLRFADANDESAARSLGVSDVQQLRKRMCLVSPDGRQTWGYDAVVELMRQGEATMPLAHVLALRPVAHVGHWIYEKIAAHRTCR